MADISKIKAIDGSEYSIKDAIARRTMIGSTDQNNGMSGQVPAPKKSDRTRFLRGDGSWAEPQIDVITNAQIDALFS